MTERAFKNALLIAATGFTAVFAYLVIPAFINQPDILGPFGAGFVNRFAAGYASDIFFCWGVLAIWVVYEAKTYSVKHGWLCLLLGVVPGVAVGFALYLILRMHQVQTLRGK